MIDSGNPPNGQRNPWRKLEARLGTGRVRNYFSIYDTLGIEKKKILYSRATNPLEN